MQPYLGNVNVRWGAFDLSDLSEMRFEPHEEERYSLLPGDLVVCEGGEPGRCAIWTGQVQRMKIQKALHRIRPKPSLDNYYLYYWFRHAANVGLLDAHFTGTTIKHLTGRAIASLQVPLPPVETQRASVDVLRRLDDRIDLLRQTNATLESIAQALFKSWFIDFDPVRAKAEGREPEGMDAATAALFPAEFEESALGLIPKGWTYRPAEELFDVGIGKTPPRKEPHWFSEGSGDMRWLSIKDMGDEGTIASRSSEFLSSEAVTRFNVRVVPSRTVLMSFKLTVGRLSITDGPMCTNEAIAHFKAREGSPQFTYLYCYLKAFDFRTLGSTSSIAEATNSKAVKALPVLFPSSRLVDAFHRASAEMFEKMFVQKSHCRRLEELRDTLLPRLISGKLRLPEALEAAEAVAA